MMKMRTRNPLARIATGNISQYDTVRAYTMAIHSSRYGITELMSCQIARRGDDTWNRAIRFRQCLVDAAGVVVTEVPGCVSTGITTASVKLAPQTRLFGSVQKRRRRGC